MLLNLKPKCQWYTLQAVDPLDLVTCKFPVFIGHGKRQRCLYETRVRTIALQSNLGGERRNTPTTDVGSLIAIIYIYLSIVPPVLLCFVVAFCFPGTCVHCYACENALRIRLSWYFLASGT